MQWYVMAWNGAVDGCKILRQLVTNGKYETWDNNGIMGQIIYQLENGSLPATVSSGMR